MYAQHGQQLDGEINQTSKQLLKRYKDKISIEKGEFKYKILKLGQT